MKLSGFTLIEISIVLVIIGLIVGGILVGRDLINAAAVRSQISQIEKYNQAVNTFRTKYGYLPGDIPNVPATQFGFLPRGAYPGAGDGDGILATSDGTSATQNSYVFTNEQGAFWEDLSTAHLIDGNFSCVSPASIYFPTCDPPSKYFPSSKIGSNGYVYAWSGGWQIFSSNTSMNAYPADGQNYFAITTMPPTFGGYPNTISNNDGGYWENPLLTAAQAYAIDKKTDDGLPQSGRVIAFDGVHGWASNYLASNSFGDSASNGGPVTASADIGANGVLQGPNSCYDARSTTAGSGTLPEQYSYTYQNGVNVTCWLSFRFQ